jgi:hypothetical protein
MMLAKKKVKEIMDERMEAEGDEDELEFEEKKMSEKVSSPTTKSKVLASSTN